MNAFPELLLALFLLAPLFFQAEKLIIWQQTFDYLFMAQVIYYTHSKYFCIVLQNNPFTTTYIGAFFME